MNKLKPKEVVIEITNVCNYKCIICPYATMNREKKFMNFNLYKICVDKTYELEPEEVSLHGWGEPLLHPQFCELMEYTKKLNKTKKYTYTNLSILDEKKAISIVNNLNELYISIDSIINYKKVRNEIGFDKIKNNIELLLDYKKKLGSSISVNLKFTGNEYLKREDLEIAKSLFGNKVNICPPTYFRSFFNRQELKKKTISLVLPCKYISKMFFIDVEGNILPCCQDLDSTMKLGYIGDGTILEIFNNDNFNGLRKRLVNKDMEDLLCKDCDNR